MRPINQDQDESGGSYQIFLADLRGKVRVKLAKGATYESLSVGMVVAPKTIQNFVEGVTKRPSSWTVERIAWRLGYRVTFEFVGEPIIPEAAPE
jgi:hypothetical protein